MARPAERESGPPRLGSMCAREECEVWTQMVGHASHNGRAEETWRITVARNSSYSRHKADPDFGMTGRILRDDSLPSRTCRAASSPNAEQPLPNRIAAALITPRDCRTYPRPRNTRNNGAGAIADMPRWLGPPR